MINAVTPINSNSKVTMASPLATYKQAQGMAQAVSQMVYQSFSMLTGSGESGITKESLNDLKTLLENENLTNGNAYKLTNTLIDSFSKLSSDGQAITQSDFMGAIKFSVAQSFSQSGALSSLIKEGSLNISQQVAAQFGSDNAQTLALMNFVDGLSSDTVAKLSSNLSSSSVKSTIKQDSYYGNDQIQDYNAVTKEQVTSPVNISV